MTNKDIKLETVYEDGVPTIHAPCSVFIKKNNKLKWDNSLKKATGDANDGVAVSIQLYKINESGNVEINAEDFCDGYSEGDGKLLVIPANGKYNCEVMYDGEFKYDVSANGYTTLDPIIIVQAPPVTRDLPDAWIIIAGLIFSALMYVVGFRRGSSEKT